MAQPFYPINGFSLFLHVGVLVVSFIAGKLIKGFSFMNARLATISVKELFQWAKP